MRKFNFFRRNKYIFILLVLAVITHLPWFNFFNILSSSDWSYWPAEATRQLYYSYGTWINFFNFGSVNVQLPFNLFTSFWSFLANFGFSYDFSAKMTFLIPVAILGFIAPYIFFKRLTKNELISLVVALFYGTTTYFLVRQTAHLAIAFIYALAPLIIYFFIEALEKNQFVDWLKFVLIFWLGICYEIRMTYIVVFILIFYFLFFFSRKFKIFFSKKILLSLLCLLGLNLFWLLPVFLSGFSKDISIVANRGLFGNFLFDIGHAFSLADSPWTGGLPNNEFIKQSIIWYLWIIPVLAFASFLLNRNSRYKREIIFFGVISLIGIFLTKQAGQPLVGVYKWLYENFPGFNLFRESSKFFLLTAIGYSGLLGYTLLILREHKKFFQRSGIFFIFSIIIILIAACNLKPLITGEIGTMFRPRQISKDYLILENFILRQQEYFRTMWVPRTSRWGFFSNINPYLSVKDTSEIISGFLDESISDNLNLQERTIATLSQNYSDNLLDLFSVKYVIVPIQDFVNNDDFFAFYGGKNDQKIRSWYIDQLDQIPYLQKINIDASDLVIYENKEYKKPIFSFNHLYLFDPLGAIDKKFNVASQAFDSDFLFVKREQSKSEIPLTYFGNLFGTTEANNLTSSGIIDSRKLIESHGWLIFNAGSVEAFASIQQGDHLVVYKQRNGHVVMNNNDIDGSAVSSPEMFNKIKLTGDRVRYIAYGDDSLVEVKGISPVVLGSVDSLNKLGVVTVKYNIVPNPSFESGTWQTRVSDCHNYDNNRQIVMSLNIEEKTDGEQSLQLEATRHIACSAQKFIVPETGEYILSFDYRGFNTQKAGYYLVFNDSAQTVNKEMLAISGQNWKSFVRRVQIPKGTTTASLYLYAYESDGKVNNIVLYDNIIFGSLLEKVIDIEILETPEFEKVPVVFRDGENVFEYRDDRYPSSNILFNHSFEDGFWNEKVGDCHRYDDNPVLAMSLNTEEKTDGEQSLQLEATRHIACTGRTVAVKSGATYLFSFDYQSPNAKLASYFIGFNDDNKTKTKMNLPLENTKWHSFSKIIKVPMGANSLSFYIYARATNEKNNIVNRYDNFKLIEVPDLSDAYYLVGESKRKLEEPEAVDFELINPTKKVIHVKGAITPFFLAMSEGYHDKWQLQMANRKINGLLNSWGPWAKPDKVSNEFHYKLNEFLNAWYVDVDSWCVVGNNSSCRKNADGSWDIDMVIEFWPQRWFYLGLIISVLTLLGVIGCLGSHWMQGRSRK